MFAPDPRIPEPQRLAAERMVEEFYAKYPNFPRRQDPIAPTVLEAATYPVAPAAKPPLPPNAREVALAELRRRQNAAPNRQVDDVSAQIATALVVRAMQRANKEREATDFLAAVDTLCNFR